MGFSVRGVLGESPSVCLTRIDRLGSIPLTYHYFDNVTTSVTPTCHPTRGPLSSGAIVMILLLSFFGFLVILGKYPFWLILRVARINT